MDFECYYVYVCCEWMVVVVEDFEIEGIWNFLDIDVIFCLSCSDVFFCVRIYGCGS